jgi:hypothetical protein
MTARLSVSRRLKAGFLIYASYAALKRRSSTGAAWVGARFWRAEVRIKTEIKIKINVKSSGQECPLHTSNLDWPREQIDEAIRRYERLLLILSPNSMSSKWVKTEIRNAQTGSGGEEARAVSRPAGVV